MKYDNAFELLLGNEGVLSLDRNDRGNWTSGKIGVGTLGGSKYGISSASYPNLDIKNLSIEEAKAIYKRDYWDKIQGDNLPSAINFDVFDTAVNSGSRKAIELLQKAVGVTVDGIIGKDTLFAVNSINPLMVCIRFNAYRLQFMTECSAWNTQGKGWARRISKNLLIRR
jgi:lysozyme family protein